MLEFLWQHKGAGGLPVYPHRTAATLPSIPPLAAAMCGWWEVFEDGPERWCNIEAATYWPTSLSLLAMPILGPARAACGYVQWWITRLGLRRGQTRRRYSYPATAQSQSAPGSTWYPSLRRARVTLRSQGYNGRVESTNFYPIMRQCYLDWHGNSQDSAHTGDRHAYTSV